MSKPVIRPALEFEWPKPMRPLINGLSKGLHSLAHAHQDDLLGFSVAWRSRQQAENAVARYIDGFYIPVRRHSSLGFQSPIAYERMAREVS